MTVAAAEAVALRDCLERGGRDLARRFFSAASAPIDHAWQLSVGADLALPEVEGRALRARAPHQRLSAPPARDGRARPRRRRGLHRGGRHARTPSPRAAPRDRRPRRPRPAPVSWQRAGRRGAPARATCRRAVARRCARPARPTPREAVVFLHGNPGSSADWEPLLAATGRRWRAVAWDAPGFGHAATRSRFRRPSRHTPSSSAARSTRSGSSASISSPTTSAGPGAYVGSRRARPVRQRGAARHRRAARLPLARARAALAHPARRRAAHGHDHPPRLSPPAAARQPARAAAAVRRPHVRRLRPRHPSRRARALPLRPRRRPRRANGSPRRCARSTDPRSCSGGATTPTYPRRPCRAPARRLPARRDPRARAKRPLALRRRPGHRHRGADRLPRQTRGRPRA